MKPYTTEDYFEKNKTKVKKEVQNKTLVENNEEKKEDENSDGQMDKKEENEDEKIENRIYFRNKSYYEYELVGVLIHSGHADAGHYFSLINTKRNGEGNKMNYNTECDFDNFLNFDDSTLSSFNIKSGSFALSKSTKSSRVLSGKFLIELIESLFINCILLSCFALR